MDHGGVAAPAIQKSAHALDAPRMLSSRAEKNRLAARRFLERPSRFAGRPYLVADGMACSGARLLAARRRTPARHCRCPVLPEFSPFAFSWRRSTRKHSRNA